MEKLKGLKIVLVILLVVLVLVIVRTTSKNRFKLDAQNLIDAVVNNNFLVSLNDLKGTESEYLIVELNKSGSVQFKKSIKVPFEKLLEVSSLEKLKATEKKIILVSDDNSVAVKAWVILNQLDFKNVFVLSTEENPEVLNYEFQPDTAAVLESVSE